MSQEDKKTVPEDFNPIIQSPRTGTKSDKSDCFKWRPRRQSRARLVWTRLMILTSLCLYISVLIWGFYFGVLSASLLDLEQLTNTRTSQVALMYTAATFGALLGAPIGGFVLSLVDARLYCGLIFMCFGCTITSLPRADSFTKLIIVATINGLLQGALDTGQNITALLIWGWNGIVFMQLFHCIFSVGAFFGPWIAKPFLAKVSYVPAPGQEGNSTSDVTDGVYGGTGILPSSSPLENTTLQLETVMGPSSVSTAFLIVGMCMIGTGMLYLVAFFLTRAERREEKKASKPSTLRSSSPRAEQDELIRNPNHDKKVFQVPMIILAFLRFGLYVGLELTFSGFVMAFAVKGMGWPKEKGLHLTTVYWGAFAASRIFSVFTAVIISPTATVVIDVVLLMSGYLCMALFFSFHPVVLYVTSVLVGLAGGSFYGASMSWYHRYMLVTQRIGGSFTTGSWAGMTALPALAGYFIQYYKPAAFLYLCMAVAILLTTVTTIATVIGLKFGRPLSLKVPVKERDEVGLVPLEKQ